MQGWALLFGKEQPGTVADVKSVVKQRVADGDISPSKQVILPTAPGVSNEGGEFSPLGSLARCFLALDSGLGLVGTASSRR